MSGMPTEALKLITESYQENLNLFNRFDVSAAQKITALTLPHPPSTSVKPHSVVLDRHLPLTPHPLDHAHRLHPFP